MQVRIMLIDDSPLIARIIKSHLSGAGYLVEVATSSLGAVNRIVDFNPHVLLVDLGLPGLRGDKIVSNLREMGVFVKPRIIIISAEDEAELQKLVASGVADDYFSKGKPITELQEKIEAQLKLSGRLV
jgi:two-component system KDP operon response regulator KdpE